MTASRIQLPRWMWLLYGTLHEAIAGDRIHVRSGFLALWCLEAVIPLLVTAGAAMSLLGHPELVADTAVWVTGRGILGSTSDDFGAVVAEELTRANLVGLGLGGAASALFLGWQLYAAAVFDLTELSRAHGGSWFRHWALFLPFLLWTALLMIGGNLATAWVVQSVPVATPVVFLGSTALLAVGLATFPRHRMRGRALFFGALAGGAWLETVKLAFWVYTTSAYGQSTLQATWGWAPFVPITMLWMHLLWFSVLLSAVVGRTVDAPESLLAWLDGHRVRLPPHRWQADRAVAARVWTTLTAREAPIEVRDLRETGVPLGLLDEIVAVWERRGLLERFSRGWRVADAVGPDAAARAWADAALLEDLPAK